MTGEECFVLKAVARSTRHLERRTGRIATLGSLTTSVGYSSPLPGRPISGAASPATPAAEGPAG